MGLDHRHLEGWDHRMREAVTTGLDPGHSPTGVVADTGEALGPASPREDPVGRGRQPSTAHPSPLTMLNFLGGGEHRGGPRKHYPEMGKWDRKEKTLQNSLLPGFEPSGPLLTSPQPPSLGYHDNSKMFAGAPERVI